MTTQPCSIWRVSQPALAAGHGRLAACRSNHHRTRGLVHISGPAVKSPNCQILNPSPGVVMLKKFQEFAVKGNAFDLAVGVIIGAAFGAIVNSLVGDVFMPAIGAVTGGLDFTNYFVPLSHK